MFHRRPFEYLCSKVTEMISRARITIPETVKRIGARAFFLEPEPIYLGNKDDIFFE